VGVGVEELECGNLGNIKCSKDKDSLRLRCKGSCGDTKPSHDKGHDGVRRA